MDRLINYPGQIPLETDLLNTNRATMIALGKVIAAVLGTGNLVNGLAVAPNSPAALNVVVAPGEIYSLQSVDATAYSSLPADTSHACMKQGISLDPTVVSCAAPATAGQSINYLIEATFQEIDGSAVVLPYYNASNPAQAFSGPANSGAAQATLRQGKVVIQAKPGVAATTGTQVTPAVDAGYVALAVVTVANGQTTITAGNISSLASGSVLAQPMLPTLQGLAAPIIGTSRSAKMTISAASATGTFSAAEIIVETASGQPFRLTNFSQTVNLSTVGANGMDVGTAPTSGYVALYAIYNPTTGASALLATNATSSVAPEVYGGGNMPAGYTASALVSVWTTNASKQFVAGLQLDRIVSIPFVSVLSTSATQGSPTALNVANAIPPNARRASGTIAASSSAASSIALSLYASASGSGIQGLNTGTSASVSFRGLPISVQQTIYYTATSTAGTPAFVIAVSEYEF